jgi:hypothetical protein
VVEVCAADLLGRHIAGRSQDEALARDCRCGLVRFGGSRQAEVEQLHAMLSQEDVRGLQIAVQQAPGVHGRERVQDRARDRGGFREAHRPADEARGQRFPVEQLHDDEVQAVLLADVVDDADVRVVERGDRACLALQPGASLGIVRDESRQYLDRHVTAEAAVVRTIHLAHAPGPERADNGIRAEGRAWQKRHR